MAYRAQPGPSQSQTPPVNPNDFPQQSATMPGRASPLAPIPQVSSNNIGQPGAVTVPSNQHVANGNGSDKGPDYVYFERKPGQFSEQTTGKAMAAKMRLELYYKEAVEGVVGRKER